MGIKPFRSHSSLSQEDNNYLYYSTTPHVSSQRVHISQIQQSQFSTLSQASKVIYQSPQQLNDQYLQKQHILSSSGEDLDTLNQYIFFLKSNAPNMDLTNLYTPVHIRTRTQGMCEQAQTTELFYPIYEYKLRAQMQTRVDRGQYFHESQVWYVIINVLNALRQFERIKCISIQFDIDCVRFNTDGHLKVNNMVSQPKTLQKLRNERMYWSHKNTVEYYAEETYRLGMVLLEICTLRNFSNSNDYYRIQEGLQIVGNKYSQLLQTLISVMLCHRQDRPLPSQIYHVFAPHKNQIVNFKPFHLQKNISQGNSRLSNLHLSNATNQQINTQNKQNYEEMWTSNNYENNFQNGHNNSYSNYNKNQNSEHYQRINNGYNNSNNNGYYNDDYVRIEDAGYNYDYWRGSQGHARSAHNYSNNSNNNYNYRNNKAYGLQSSVSNNQYDNQYPQNHNINQHFTAITSPYPYSQPNNTNYNTGTESQGITNFANSIHGSKVQGRNGSLQNSRQPYPISYLNVEDARGYSTSNQQIKSSVPISNANNRELSRGGGPSRQRSFAPIENDYYYHY